MGQGTITPAIIAECCNVTGGLTALVYGLINVWTDLLFLKRDSTSAFNFVCSRRSPAGRCCTTAWCQFSPVATSHSERGFSLFSHLFKQRKLPQTLSAISACEKDIEIYSRGQKVPLLPTKASCQQFGTGIRISKLNLPFYTQIVAQLTGTLWQDRN